MADDEMMLFRRRPTYRDARGRFRRQTYADMNAFERLHHDTLARMIPGLVESITRPSIFEMANKTIGRTVRVRLPTDFTVIDRMKI